MPGGGITSGPALLCLACFSFECGIYGHGMAVA